MIQSLVWKKANALAEEHLSNQFYSDNLFKAWKGLFIRRIHTKLKTKMNVVRYTAIRREKFDEAKSFLENLTYADFSLRDLQPTLSILNILEKEGDSNEQ